MAKFDSELGLTVAHIEDVLTMAMTHKNIPASQVTKVQMRACLRAINWAVRRHLAAQMAVGFDGLQQAAHFVIVGEDSRHGLSQAQRCLFVCREQPGGLWLASASQDEWPDEIDPDEIEAMWEEPWGDRRQELVIIGVKLGNRVLDELDGCCLTDDELAAGPTEWLTFDDPFPAWVIGRGGEDDGEDDTVVEDEAP